MTGSLRYRVAVGRGLAPAVLWRDEGNAPYVRLSTIPVGAIHESPVKSPSHFPQAENDSPLIRGPLNAAPLVGPSVSLAPMAGIFHIALDIPLCGMCKIKT